jgi:hypothetical protein
LRRDAVAGRSLRPANPDGREIDLFYALAGAKTASLPGAGERFREANGATPRRKAPRPGP